MDDARLSQAVLLAIGTWRSDVPRIDTSQLLEPFGVTQGRRLGLRVEALARELLSDEDFDDPLAAFAEQHPELSSEALAAFEWWYTANFAPLEWEFEYQVDYHVRLAQ